MADLEMPRSFRSGPQRDHGGLMVRPLLAGDRLNDNQHIQNPPFEQHPSLIQPHLLPRGRKVPSLVEHRRQALHASCRERANS